MPERLPLPRRAAAEALGTALLLVAVVGSGITGERLAGGSVGLALLANTLATGAALLALIAAFGPVSGAHFNPAVTIADATQRGLPWRDVPAYVAAQVVGALAGVALAHLMFGLPAWSPSTHARAGVGNFVSEVVATGGLLAVIWGCARRRPSAAVFAVPGWIVAGYWCTASTAFANPAVAIARSLTDTFSGIRPIDVPAFIAAEALGAAAATIACRWLMPSLPSLPAVADRVVVPHAAGASA